MATLRPKKPNNTPINTNDASEPPPSRKRANRGQEETTPDEIGDIDEDIATAIALVPSKALTGSLLHLIPSPY